MSEVKCPFCQQELDKIYLIPEALVCMNCHRLATKELWQELIRTRRALDVAVGALKYLYTETKGNHYRIPDLVVLSKALEQITAPEQKD